VLRAVVRDANQTTHAGNDRRGDLAPPQLTRCECGDPRCEATVALTRAEFDALCGMPNHFLVVCDPAARRTERHRRRDKA
jgi:hypothetical protein